MGRLYSKALFFSSLSRLLPSDQHPSRTGLAKVTMTPTWSTPSLTQLLSSTWYHQLTPCSLRPGPLLASPVSHLPAFLLSHQLLCSVSLAGVPSSPLLLDITGYQSLDVFFFPLYTCSRGVIIFSHVIYMLLNWLKDWSIGRRHTEMQLQPLRISLTTPSPMYKTFPLDASQASQI